MYRLMIVDDEPIIRRGLLNFIQWESIDCSIEALAVDGIDAIEKLKTSNIDIVISDIKMPEMNGIELSKYIYENFPKIKVIILTAYSDFSFSQSAIKYGVIDFVLKPTSKNKLLEAVEKAKQLIKMENEKERKIKSLEDKISANSVSLQEHFLFKLINNIKMNNSRIVEEMNSLGIKLAYYFSIIVKIDDKQPKPDGTNNNDNNILSIKSYINKSLKDYNRYVIILDNQTLSFFISFDTNDYYSNLEKIMNLSKDIIALSNNFLGIDVSIGISNIHDNTNDISKAYTEAGEALANRFFMVNNFFVYTDYSHNDEDEQDLIKQYFQEILEKIKYGNSSEAINILEKTFEIYKRSNQSIENIKSNNILLYSLIINLSLEKNLNHLDLIGDDKKVFSKIWKSKSSEGILLILSRVIEAICDRINSEKKDSNYIIEKANDYINENYMNNITLSTIAEFIHVNSSYLSRLYKQETNKNITTFITEVRLEKAKNLLLTTEMKIYEIAESVGIENSTYFSILFKKYTGYNPKDYKIIKRTAK